MIETVTMEQAKEIDALLHTVGRHLLATGDDPVADLPLGQMRVCVILYRGPRPMSVLSRELGVSLSALTQIADRLERAHLVRRVAEGTDRRVRCLKLTERGEGIMRQREATRLRRVAALLEHLPPKAREEALAVLEMLASACEAISAHETRTAALNNVGGS